MAQVKFLIFKKIGWYSAAVRKKICLLKTDIFFIYRFPFAVLGFFLDLFNSNPIWKECSFLCLVQSRQTDRLRSNRYNKYTLSKKTAYTKPYQTYYSDCIQSWTALFVYRFFQKTEIKHFGDKSNAEQR